MKAIPPDLPTNLALLLYADSIVDYAVKAYFVDKDIQEVTDKYIDEMF